MATNKPIELYFTGAVYSRGEHVIGENATLDSGSINMVHVKRGETRKVQFDAARDLIIARQAIDVRAAKPGELEDAKKANQAHDEFVAKMDRNEKAKLKQAA